MKSELIGKTYRFLISRQFAVWSLVLLAVLLVVGGTLPDLSQLSAAELTELQQSRPFLHRISSNLQTRQLTRSPLFLVLPGAIWLSTALCMVRRLRRDNPRSARLLRSREADFEGAACVSIDRPIASAAERVLDLLQGRRWQTEEVSENGAVRYFAQKGSQGFWGSVVFHLSMLIFLVGIIVSILGRFDAEMILTEGQTLAFAEDQMLRVNAKGSLTPELPGTLVSLERFESKFAQGKYPVDYAAHLKLVDGPLSIRDETVRVNGPVKHGRWQIFLHRYGFAPRFEIRDGAGGLLFDSFVNLIVLRPEQTDHFDVPSLGLRVDMRFFPDYAERNGSAVSRSPTPENPVMRMRALADGESIGEADVSLGETAEFGAYRITFADLRYWAWFGVAYDPGYALIIIAFTSCVAGLAVRFGLSEKWLHVKVEERDDASVVSLTGCSRYFPALFENEIDGLCEQLLPEPGGAKAKRGGCE